MARLKPRALIAVTYEMQNALEESRRQADVEKQWADEEKRRADELQQRLASLERELAELRGRTPSQQARRSNGTRSVK